MFHREKNHRARDVAVGRFMQKTDAEYFMFIDADVDFDPASVVRLIRSGHEVSVAVDPKVWLCLWHSCHFTFV